MLCEHRNKSVCIPVSYTHLFVKEINIKELLMLKVLMYSASAEKHLDSVQTAVDNNMKFEEIITEKVKQIMGGNEK